jgi:beta-glucosidase
VIGPGAYPAETGGGGSADAKPFVAVSYLEGLENYLGGNAKVYYDRGIPTLQDMAKQTEFTVEANGGKKGLKAEVFTNADLQGTPALTRTDKYLTYQPARGEGGTYSNMSIRWTGYFSPATPGQYLAFAQGPGENGGYRVYVDKKLVVDNWKSWYAFVSQIPLTLAAGSHQIEFDYCVRSGWGKTTANLGIVRAETLVSAEAKSLATHADAVVLAVGFDADTEGESGDREFRLPPGQDELIKQIAAVNKKTAVVVTSGGGVDMSGWVDTVPAILEAWYPGQEGGTAVAQLLLGEFDPSGKLPISIERRWEDNAAHDSYHPKDGEKKVTYKEGLFIGYRHYDKSGIKPLFPFGFGLSYTTFDYKNLTVSQPQTDLVAVAFDLTNTGSRAGEEVCEIYVGDKHAPVPRPVKELKGFQKVKLNPGQTKHVQVTLDRRAFSYYDVKDRQWKVAPGEFELYVATSAAQIELTGKVTIQ